VPAVAFALETLWSLLRAGTFVIYNRIVDSPILSSDSTPPLQGNVQPGVLSKIFNLKVLR
jgi:hypothetical protein